MNYLPDKSKSIYVLFTILLKDGEKILKNIDSYLGFEIEDIGIISFDAYR